MTRSQATGTIPLQADIRDALRIAAQRTSDALAQALMRDAADKLDRLESERADLYAALRELLARAEDVTEWGPTGRPLRSRPRRGKGRCGVSCNHHWIGGTPHTVRARTISPKGERPREVFDILDAAGECVDTYSCEEEARESAERLCFGVCSECGETAQRCEGCGALTERLTYTPDDIGLCSPCARENVARAEKGAQEA